MNEAKKNKSWFYPGSIWAKRIAKILIISGIGLNLFINSLQETMLMSSAEMLDLASSLKEPANNLKELTEEKIIPLLDYIENSKLSSFTSNVPSSNDLDIHIQNYSVFQSTLTDNGKMLSFLGLFLKIANIIFWIPIVLSAIWLLYDIQYGNVRILTLILLGGATWFSYWSYHWLCSNIPF